MFVDLRVKELMEVLENAGWPRETCLEHAINCHWEPEEDEVPLGELYEYVDMGTTVAPGKEV